MALNDVPLSGQTLNDTRNPIRNNFLTINSTFLVNHKEYNTADAGKHTFVTLLDQTGNVLPFVGNEGAVYNFLFPQTGTREIWFRMPTTGINYPVSNCILSTNGNPGLASNGWQYGAGGTLEKWGASINPGVGNVAINLSAFGPAFTVTPWNAQISPYQVSTASTSFIVNITTTTLTVFNTGGSFMWRVIGA